MESHLRKEVGQTVIDFQREVARRRPAPSDCVSMTDRDDTRDRMIRVESNMAHMEKQLTDMQVKVNAMHELLMQAKGMRLLIIAMAAIAGFFSAYISKYIPFLR
jgi:hypothetical protein